MKKITECVFFAGLALALAGCNLFGGSSGTVSARDLASLQKVFMSSYYAERGGTPAGARGLTPFLGVSRASTGARTTVPTAQLADSSFASLVGATTAISAYPENDQTTTFTVTVKDASNSVYDVTATTTYPSTDTRSSYVEEYCVKDGNPTWGTAADGIWNADDPVVKLSGGSWVQDQAARVRQILTFTDGTTRTETIVAQTRDWGVSPTNTPRFDAFPIDGSLEFDQAFYPAQSADSRVLFSSVVKYYVTPSQTTDTSYWFWKGSQTKTILGIRYYTEYWDAAAGTFTSYTICFERTLNTIATADGDFATVLKIVTVGSSFDTLAESVLRQQVTYGLDSAGRLDRATGSKTTRMQTRVVDVGDNKDIVLTQMDSDSAAWEGGWTEDTIATPTSTADEVTAGHMTESELTFLTERAYTESSTGVPLVVESATVDNTGTGNLATVYASIVEGAALITTGTAIPGSLIPAGREWFFDGTQGKTVEYDSAYDLTTTGTVEAWVYINAQTNTGGIVHKGDLANFTDECYSLQFWGSGGQVSMIVDYNSSNSYSQVLSKTNLATGKWYYLVATWDATASTPILNLYINGALNNSATSTAAKLTAQLNASDLHVGAQIPVTYSTYYGYFGFDGKINGVRVSKAVSSAAAIAADYATYVTATSGW
jgi:hypothetical protein